MGRRGRQPKKSTPGKLATLPNPPASLGAVGKRKWRQIGGQLVRERLIDPVDRHALEELCLAYDQRGEAVKILEKEGLYCESEKGGKYPHPALNIKFNADKQINEYIKALGMTRRTRLEIETTQEDLTSKVAARKR